MRVPLKRDTETTLQRRIALGKRLRVLRERAGLTMAQAADKIGVRAHVYWRWEIGECSIPSERLVDILTALGCQIRHIRTQLQAA